MRIFAILGLTALTACSFAAILEDFETDLSNYTTASGTPNAVLQAASAHDGGFGAFFPGTGPAHYYDSGIGTSAGNIYRGYVRHNAGLTAGRIYMGINAGPGGFWSAVLGDNTNQILLQQNTPYGSFVTLASASFTPTRGVWYQLELNWAANGDMTVSVLNEAGTSVLASTTPFATGQTGSGGLGFRGFNGYELDTIYENVVPEPGTMIALGAGIAALAARRRRK